MGEDDDTNDGVCEEEATWERSGDENGSDTDGYH